MVLSHTSFPPLTATAFSNLSHTYAETHILTNDILQHGSRLCQYLGKGDGWHGNNRLMVHLLLPPTRMVPDKLDASQKALGDLESQLHVFFTPPTPQRDQCLGDYGAGRRGSYVENTLMIRLILITCLSPTNCAS